MKPDTKKVIVVLFNLKAGIAPAAYEKWANERDLPTVRNLPSNESFRVFKTQGIMGQEGSQAPYAYVEVVEVKSLELLGQDVQTEAMQRVIGEFAQYADNPVYMVTEQFSN